jgi:hypothetical protein
MVFSGVDGSVLQNFDAFEPTFTGGVFVAAADFTGDGVAQIVVAPDEGGGPRVRVLDGKTLKPVADFLGIDDPAFRGGARVSVGDVNGDYVPDLVVAAGFGGGPRVAVYNGSTLSGGNPTELVHDFFAFEDTLRNGAFPAVGDLNGDGFADLVFGGGPGGAPRVLAVDGSNLLAGNVDPLASFYAGDPADRSGVGVGVAPGSDGSLDILAAALAGGSAGQYNLAGTSVGSYDPFAGSSGGFSGGLSVGSAPEATQTATNRTSKPAAGTTEFNHYVVISNVKGTYTGSYNTTVRDDQANTEDVRRVDVTLTIDSMTPESPNADPAQELGNYKYTGEVTVRVAGKGSITVPVYGTYSLSQFPKDPFTNQVGSLNIYTQGVTNYYNPGRPTAVAVGGDDLVSGRWQTNVFDFQKPGAFHTTAPNGNLTLTRN